MLEITPVSVEAVVIRGADSLDPIHVFWVNVSPGQGYVTAICYGCAWTAYFGGMMGVTIQEFFADCDVSYLVNKMGSSSILKEGKKYDSYLARIVKAIQQSLIPTVNQARGSYERHTG